LLLWAKGINEGRVFADRFYATGVADGAAIASQRVDETAKG
jgi:hypothetical protein